MMTEASMRAVNKYNRTHTKAVTIRLSKKYDTDIIEALSQVDNQAGYIKSLIRADLERAKGK